MTEFIMYFGSGVLSFLIAGYITKRDARLCIQTVLEIIAYTYVNFVLLVTILSFLGRIVISNAGNGLVICHGRTSVPVSLILSVISGIVSTCPCFRIKIKKYKDLDEDNA